MNEKNKGVRFVRIRGRIVPIKISKESKRELKEGSALLAGGATVGVASAYGIGRLMREVVNRGTSSISKSLQAQQMFFPGFGPSKSARQLAEYQVRGAIVRGDTATFRKYFSMAKPFQPSKSATQLAGYAVKGAMVRGDVSGIRKYFQAAKGLSKINKLVAVTAIGYGASKIGSAFYKDKNSLAEDGGEALVGTAAAAGSARLFQGSLNAGYKNKNILKLLRFAK